TDGTSCWNGGDHSAVAGVPMGNFYISYTNSGNFDVTVGSPPGDIGGHTYTSVNGNTNPLGGTIHQQNSGVQGAWPATFTNTPPSVNGASLYVKVTSHDGSVPANLKVYDKTTPPSWNKRTHPTLANAMLAGIKGPIRFQAIGDSYEGSGIAH